jgi:proprotein convertase subtilisin/kexin type 5|mmetsp:Transcript_13465/g.18430  ORF Transcript_13465/g.18430 Transcript_13465/m.18430 type:complete len:217 (+) Transcript_13465:924-1574(+)
MVPTLKCVYPCRECPESDRANCLSCWTEAFSDYKYFFYNEDTGKGSCELSCPAGFTRHGDDSFVCVNCDSSCATCLDSDKFSCVRCHPDFPYSVSGTGICLEYCKRGYYETQTLNTCATCDPLCADCKGSPKTCTACHPNSDKPFLFDGTCIGFCDDGYTDVFGVCERCISPCSRCEGTPDYCTFCDGTLGRRILYKGMCLAECPSGSALKPTDDG